MSRRILIVTVVLATVLVLGACMAPRGAGKVGLVGGTLRPCPSSPNCVCSTAGDDDPVHAVDPLPLDLEPERAVPELRRIVESFPRTRIVDTGERYLHATFTSLVFRFTDDVEFLVDEDAGVIHVRSASRIGYSDLGANRSRVDALREAWAER